MTVGQAAAGGARTMIIGEANAGGVLSAAAVPEIVAALEAGLDVASGLHQRLGDVPAIREAAERLGRRLFDVRQPPGDLAVGKGTPRAGLRLLSVGSDCSMGKMYTSLALEREMRARGMKADFRATGQTGILIAGSGVSVDAVVSDFVAGAVEWLAPANDPDHWDIVEGQASVLHPSYGGVTLGLCHGSQPDALVCVHEPTRPHMRGLPGRPVPSIADTIAAHVAAARITNPDCKCVLGLAIKTFSMGEAVALAYLKQVEDEYDLPACDPVRTGCANVVDAIQRAF
jgi:uncharacterized NAD-dependent epimerase/dehydratase family protein